MDVVALVVGWALVVSDRPMSIQRDAADFYTGLPTIGQVGVAVAGTLVLGAVVLGILPGYSDRTVGTARRSPVISILIGGPGTLVLATLLYISSLISDHSLGVFFAIPLVSIGLTLLPAWAALGVVAFGRSLSSRLGRDRIGTGLFAGAIVVGLAAIVPELLVVVLGIVASLGVGAGVRVLVNAGTTTNPEERSVPPANKI